MSNAKMGQTLSNRLVIMKQLKLQKILISEFSNYYHVLRK